MINKFEIKIKLIIYDYPFFQYHVGKLEIFDREMPYIVRSIF